MAISQTLESFLRNRGVAFDLLPHPRSFGSMATAQAAHIPGDVLVKGVVLHDPSGSYALAVLPSTHRVELGALQQLLHHDVALATEDEIAQLFRDCDRGSVPAVGEAYGVFTLVDDSITGEPEVYFEAGDHASLIHMNGEAFAGLMGSARHGRFSHHV